MLVAAFPMCLLRVADIMHFLIIRNTKVWPMQLGYAMCVVGTFLPLYVEAEVHDAIFLANYSFVECY